MGGAVVVMKSDGVYRFDSDESAEPWLRVFRGQTEVYKRRKNIGKRNMGKRSTSALCISPRSTPKNADEFQQQWAAKRNVPPPFITTGPR